MSRVDSQRVLLSYFQKIVWLLILGSYSTIGAAADTDLKKSQPKLPRQDAALHDVSFANQHVGWAVGSLGTILHSTDGGATWQPQDSSTSAELYAIHAIDSQQAWAVGGTTDPISLLSRGVVLRTANGGKTWKSLQPLTPALRDVHFQDAQHGWTIGASSSGQLSGAFATSDGGQSWRPLWFDERGDWATAHFSDDGLSYAVGRSGMIALIDRDRLEILQQADTAGRQAHCFVAASHSDWWIAGKQGLLARCDTRSGKTTSLTLPASIDLLCLTAQENRLWVGGAPGGAILHSPDGGTTWQSQATGIATPIRQLTFIDAQHGWAVGELGKILRTTDGGESWQIVRNGNLRAAAMIVAADEHSIPLQTVTEVALRENLRTTIHLLARTSSDQCVEARLAEALAPLGVVGVSVNQCSTTQASSERLLSELERWRPDLVILPTSESSQPLGYDPLVLLRPLVEETEREWQISRVFQLRAPGLRGTHHVKGEKVVPDAEQTIGELAIGAAALIRQEFQAQPAADELQLVANSPKIATPPSTNLLAGMQFGSEARRVAQTVLSTHELQAAQQRIQQRRNLLGLLAASENSSAWTTQLASISGELTASHGAAMLYGLAESQKQAGEHQVAALTLMRLSNRYPEEQLSKPALIWLVSYFAGSETAHTSGAVKSATLQANSATNPQQAETKNSTAVVSATYEETSKAPRALQIGRHIAQSDPLLYMEPAVRVPIAACQRRWGQSAEAERYWASLARRPQDDPWRHCAVAEEWLKTRSGRLEVKPVAACPLVADRPVLDGKLDDSTWQRLEPIEWQEGPHQTQLYLARDEEYLYVAVQATKVSGVEYPIVEQLRSYDSDLRKFDRVSLWLDLDRDYTTGYRLTIDSRGWTGDACWQNKSWNPRWFVAPGEDNNYWRAEAAIPWAELATSPPAAGTAWAMAAERTIPGQASQSWQGTIQKYPAPQNFGLLLLD